MIKEDYVQFKAARLLKDAGFPQGTRYVRDSVKHLVRPVRPTQAQAMRWLRDEHQLLIQVHAETDGLYFDIQDMSDRCYISGFPGLDGNYPTYEAAAEAGIQAVCKYLIEKGEADGSN